MNNQNICVICGQKSATTYDHIPPKCIFPEPRPSDLITIPACEECNKSTETLDEEFRVFINMFVGNKSVETEKLWKNTLRTLQHNSRLLEKAKASFRPADLTSEHSIIIGKTNVVVWDNSVNKVFEKIICGLYWYHFREILVDRVMITVCHKQSISSTAVETVKLWESNFVGNGQFLYKYVRAHDVPLRSAWLLVFHKSLAVFGYTNPIL